MFNSPKYWLWDFAVRSAFTLFALPATSATAKRNVSSLRRLKNHGRDQGFRWSSSTHLHYSVVSETVKIDYDDVRRRISKNHIEKTVLYYDCSTIDNCYRSIGCT